MNKDMIILVVSTAIVLIVGVGLIYSAFALVTSVKEYPCEIR